MSKLLANTFFLTAVALGSSALWAADTVTRYAVLIEGRWPEVR